MRVTEAVEVNAAVSDGVTVTATCTEPGYSTAGLRNGNRADKAWSNWRSGAKNPTGTVTVTLPTARDLTRVVTWFYQDGPGPVVDVPVTAATSAVRIVYTARPNSYLTISELEVHVKAPG